LARRRDDATLIRQLEASYDDAWRRADVDALVACLTEDAVVLNPRGEWAHGRDEIREMLDAFLSDEASGSVHESTITSIEFVTDDVAVVDARADISDVGDGGSITHLFSDIVVRSPDGWRIAHIRAYAMDVAGP
jgi:uncharacterized protein (TIGR02246 family)